MTAITLETIEAKQTELCKLIDQFKANANKLFVWIFPEVNIELQPGERYAGPVLDEVGHIAHHLVLLAQRPNKKLAWQAAMDWAKEAGGTLPNRQEQALLYANCKSHLKPEWHWSCETHKEDASFAWLCYFGIGNQSLSSKSYEGCAVAVRRV